MTRPVSNWKILAVTVGVAAVVAAAFVFVLWPSTAAVEYLAHRSREGGRNLLTMAIPAEVKTFRVSDGAGGVLWRIEAIEAVSSLDVIHYGEIPPGYRQLAPPENRPPRPFVKGEPLETETITTSRAFIHSGSAIDSNAFVGSYYEARPRDPVASTP